MKNIRLYLFSCLPLLSRLSLALILLIGTHTVQAATEIPERSNTLVTDYTQTLSASEQQTLESKLVAFNDTTSTQIAVVVTKTTGEYDIFDYAIRLFNKWEIGQKGKNNGVLMLVAIEDRKVFIVTGQGMEGVLPDALCKRIINNVIRPAFREGNYYQGISDGVDAIMGIVKGEYTADQVGNGQREKGIPWFVVIIFVIIFIIVIISRFNSTRSYARRNNVPFWVAWSLLNAALNRGRSRGSWGGFSGGGGWGGGGGGGGFGGFGGGFSSGGGAGGSW